MSVNEVSLPALNDEITKVSFKIQFSSELNRAVCWYLTCDRYWENTKRNQRHTPWYLLVTFSLSSGISACY
ncbi:hypothetical protein HCN44_004897 [Aphidius gifuensis]|uniref:Uncharacterized protein n=1 Tax=Aphidius gifuensis TaxID=684658 RepID=A0A835CSS3_APHGI|nr:hypothetical protein HCN44_004897 [Aphidius gifuensis]